MIKANIPHKTFKFPVGELQVNLTPESPWTDLTVVYKFDGNESIIELLLFVDAAKRSGHTLGSLIIPYVPFSRQDRTNTPGEAFSLKVFADLINGLGFKEVVIDDPHSDVTPALIHNVRVNHQWSLLAPLILSNVLAKFYLVSPDAGALKKTHKLAQVLNTPRLMGVIESSKIRNTSTGDITGTVVHASGLIRSYTVGDQDVPISYVIADDICDGGRTFIELAKELRGMGAETIHLYVTHGFFTKGKQVFNGLIDEVHAVHDRLDYILMKESA